MAEKGSEAQKKGIEGNDLNPVHTLVFKSLCECCEERHVVSVTVATLPPPEWEPSKPEPGLLEMTATGTDNASDHWIEIMRMEQQERQSPLCGFCTSVLKDIWGVTDED
tara:strand:+ start:72 stop:398 length:327 start_codon:yes stop_codon:yes gene_type:complete